MKETLKNSNHLAITGMWSSERNIEYSYYSSFCVQRSITIISVGRQKHKRGHYCCKITYAANIKKAINNGIQKYHHPCVADTLNLRVQDAITGTTTLGTLLKKCRSVVGYFRRSAEAAEALKST